MPRPAAGSAWGRPGEGFFPLDHGHVDQGLLLAGRQNLPRGSFVVAITLEQPTGCWDKSELAGDLL